MSRALVSPLGIFAALLALLLPSVAAAYRPFVSTDAAVAGPGTMEVEFGTFTLEHTGDGDTFLVPQVVLNYGFLQDWEFVGELALAKSPDEGVDAAEPSLAVKHVLKDGFLQDAIGPSVAIELEALLPGTAPGEGRLGFEGAGIVSTQLTAFAFHLNLGGGITQRTEAFGLWGLIEELPLVTSLRQVGEVNGEIVGGESPDSSGLLGCIWQASESEVFLDAAVRRGISGDAPTWMFTTGVTFTLPPPAPGQRM